MGPKFRLCSTKSLSPLSIGEVSFRSHVVFMREFGLRPMKTSEKSDIRLIQTDVQVPYIIVESVKPDAISKLFSALNDFRKHSTCL